MPEQRLRKRPIEIAGMRWTGDNEQELASWTGSRFRAVPAGERGERPEITAEVFDHLHDTWIGLRTGDTVLRGTRGEFYPIAAATLAETYDVVGAGVS